MWVLWNDHGGAGRCIEQHTAVVEKSYRHRILITRHVLQQFWHTPWKDFFSGRNKGVFSPLTVCNEWFSQLLHVAAAHRQTAVKQKVPESCGLQAGRWGKKNRSISSRLFGGFTDLSCKSVKLLTRLLLLSAGPVDHLICGLACLGLWSEARSPVACAPSVLSVICRDSNCLHSQLITRSRRWNFRWESCGNSALNHYYDSWCVVFTFLQSHTDSVVCPCTHTHCPQLVSILLPACRCELLAWWVMCHQVIELCVDIKGFR